MRHVFLLAIVAASLGGVSGCRATCENEQLANIASPSGTSRAVVFSRNCGTTTGFNTQVFVLPMATKPPNGGGNVLVVDGAVPLLVRWESESSLSVSGFGSAKVFKQELKVGNVAVSYAN